MIFNSYFAVEKKVTVLKANNDEQQRDYGNSVFVLVLVVEGASKAVVIGTRIIRQVKTDRIKHLKYLWHVQYFP